MRQIEAGIGESGFVEHLPVHEDLIVSLAKVGAGIGLVNRTGVVIEAADRISSADNDGFIVEVGERHSRMGWCYGLMIGAALDLDDVAGVGDVGRFLDRSERLQQSAGTRVSPHVATIYEEKSVRPSNPSRQAR